MATDPSKNLAPESLPLTEKNTLAQMLESDLADLSVRELLSMLLSSVGLAERKAYLERIFPDKPNGFYDRSLQLGTIPVEIRVPRTRSGDFRPASLPPLYQRGYSDETQALLLSLLTSGRSLHAVKDALHKMGLSTSPQELEAVATGLIEELDLRNTRPLDPDLLALFWDGKKQVLTCLPRAGRENLEDWKFVLRNLLERGLRRVLLLVQDDFSGLLPITQGLFPNTDVQLCAVHMQRNAKTHLSKPDAGEFQQRWRAIKSSWNLEVGNQQFEQLCDRFAKHYPTFITELRKKRLHYLAFLSYPENIRRSLSTTNVVEAINGQLEIMRRNSGGYFHSQETLKLKLGLAVSSLEQGKWKSLAKNIAAVLHQFNAMFQSRFETDA